MPNPATGTNSECGSFLINLNPDFAQVSVPAIKAENETTIFVGYLPAQPLSALTKAVSQNRVSLGGIVSYTVTVTNSGEANAGSQVTSNVYSSGVVLVPGLLSVSAGSFSTAVQGGIWSLPSVATNSTPSFTRPA